MLTGPAITILVAVTTVHIKSPDNLADLRPMYVQHFAVSATAEEVILDACQVQPQSVDASKDTVTAAVASRIIISIGHARRLVDILQQVIELREGGN